jgi:hypothetical protein
MTSLEALKARAEVVRDRFEEQWALLHRFDGSKVYAEEKHAERLASLRAECNEALRQIEAEVEAAIEEATTEIEVLQHGDVTKRLTANELERASARLALIMADVTNLSRDELLERLSAVRHSGDRASEMCYWLAARGRVSGDDDEMLEVLKSLEEQTISESHRARIEAARRTLEEVGEVKEVIYLALTKSLDDKRPTSVEA